MRTIRDIPCAAKIRGENMLGKENPLNLSALIMVTRRARYTEIVLSERAYILEQAQLALDGRTVPTVVSQQLMKLTEDLSRRHAAIVDTLVMNSYPEYERYDDKTVRAMQELLSIVLARLASWGYQVSLSQDRRQITLHKIPIV